MSIFNKKFTKKNKSGDISKLVFKLCYEKAYKAAYFYSGDANISEEAAQEAIFKAIQNIEQLRDPNKIEAWVKRIAINNVNAIFKKKQRIISLEVAPILVDSIENSPEFFCTNNEVIEVVDNAIASLNPAIKQVIHLYYYEEMKIKDIVLLLQKPEGTIKTLLYRGRNIIKGKLIRKGYFETSSEECVKS
jgi:RNA polymerase sigma-70 factor (ECF subfamily)